jgi:DNA-binding beta-propeller fold protein YncE
MKTRTYITIFITFFAMLAAIISCGGGGSGGGSNDTTGSNGIIDGIVSTIAGNEANFFKPCGVATDGKFCYIADTGNWEIRKIDISSGVISTLAGSTQSGNSDGTGSAASFSSPYGIAIDPTGRFLYATDNSVI